MVQLTFGQGAVDHFGGSLDEAALVGVLDPQDEGAPRVPGDQPGIKRRSQIAHMHIPRGGGREPGAHLALGDLGLHLLKILHVQCHVILSSSIRVFLIIVDLTLFGKCRLRNFPPYVMIVHNYTF